MICNRGSIHWPWKGYLELHGVNKILSPRGSLLTTIVGIDFQNTPSYQSLTNMINMHGDLLCSLHLKCKKFCWQILGKGLKKLTLESVTVSTLVLRRFKKKFTSFLSRSEGSPKKTLWFPTSHMLDILSNSMLKTCCTVSGISVAGTGCHRHLEKTLWRLPQTCLKSD